jgi:hypothetical protein
MSGVSERRLHLLSQCRKPGAAGICSLRVVPLGCVSKITKAHYRRLDLHIFVEKPRRSTTAPVFFVSICKPIQHNCIFQTLETHPSNPGDYLTDCCAGEPALFSAVSVSIFESQGTVP